MKKRRNLLQPESFKIEMSELQVAALCHALRTMHRRNCTFDCGKEGNSIDLYEMLDDLDNMGMDMIHDFVCKH